MGLDLPVTPFAGFGVARLETGEGRAVVLPLPFGLREETATCWEPSIRDVLVGPSGIS